MVLECVIQMAGQAFIASIDKAQAKMKIHTF
jgi:hypothetical protein